MAASHRVEGFVSPGFEAVRDAFVENFDGGGSWAAPVRISDGQKVVDLWGGVRNK